MKKLMNFACILLCLSMLCSCSAKVDTQATTTETTTTQEISSTTELQTELTTEESTTETTTEEITETTTVPVQTEEPFEEKIIVNFGDSIFGNYQDLSGENQSISSMIADTTGATVYNCGFGGCKMAYASGTGHQWFSMVKIADSIASGDFSTQENAIPNWSAFEYYGKKSFETLKAIDFNKVDIITIAYGTNDYSVGIDLDNSRNPYDIYTYGGALRYSIQKIKSAYPHIKIFVCTPIYRYWVNNGICTDSNTVKNADGNLLTDFVSLTKEIAKDLGIICIDNYYGSGINTETKELCFSNGDTTHPNLYGRKLIAQNIVSVLKKS